MWTLQADVFDLPVPQGATKKAISSLQSGEIFSVNAKSKKFAFNRLASANEKEDQSMAIIANELIGTEQVGTNIVLPCSEYQDREVISWGMLPIYSVRNQEEFDVFDRVILADESNGKILGTIIDIRNSAFPGRDHTVFYDHMLNGQWVNEYPANALRNLGVKAEGSILKAARQARPVVRELRDQHEKKALADLQASSRAEIELKAQENLDQHEREEYRKNLDDETKKQAHQISEQIMSVHANECKSMVDACLIAITSNEFNYDIDQVGELITSFGESIRTFANQFTESDRLKFLATRNVANQLVSLVHNGYFLVREGYIRKLPQDAGWAVYAKKGKSYELKSKHPIKKAAQAQIRKIEMMKRQGMDEDAV